MNLRTLLKEIRKSRKWSLRQAASHIGIDFTVLSRLESGKALDHRNLSKLIRWLFS